MLSYLDSDAGKTELAGIGGLSSATVGVLLRSLTGLEDEGGNEFFGEPMLDVHDLMRTAPDGRGIISCLELPAVQDKPTLFSTALMWLLAQLFEELPEAGDLDRPKLAFFFDEAHLLFDEATKAFLTSVAQTVRLTRKMDLSRARGSIRRSAAEPDEVGAGVRSCCFGCPSALLVRGCGRA